MTRKLEVQRENYNLMTQILRTQNRVNRYVDNNSLSGKMMSKQTRPQRAKKDLDLQNLSLYLQIVDSKPSVFSAKKLRQMEKQRTKLSHSLRNKTLNATRVKKLADAKLSARFGSGGSSNRLFKLCNDTVINRFVPDYHSPAYEQMELEQHRHSRMSAPYHTLSVDEHHLKQPSFSKRPSSGKSQKSSRPNSGKPFSKRPISATGSTADATHVYLESQSSSKILSAGPARKRTPMTAGHGEARVIKAAGQGSAIVPAFLTSMRQKRILETAASAKTHTMQGSTAIDSSDVAPSTEVVFNSNAAVSKSQQHYDDFQPVEATFDGAPNQPKSPLSDDLIEVDNDGVDNDEDDHQTI